MSASLLRRSAMIMFLSLFSSVVFAKRMRYLVKYQDDKPTPQLATKWTKTEGGYEFKLDTTLEVAKDKKVNAEMVKTSIERRLKRKGMTIEISGDDTVTITFKGDEEKFWKTLSRARVKASNVQIAMEAGGSSGGIRANKISRKPKAGEIRASYISMNKDKGYIEVFVYAVGPDGIPAAIKPSKKLKVKAPKGMKPMKKDDILYIKPIRLEGETWSTKGISLK